MLTALVDVLLPVVIVAAAGVVLSRRFRLDADTLGKVNLYAFTPAIAFRSMMTTSLTASDSARLVAGYLLATLAAGTLAWLVTRRWPPNTRRAVTACTVLGNNGNFGLPIALLALGAAGLEQAIVIFVCSIVVIFTIGPILLGASGGVRGGLLTVALLPVTWALIAAGVLRWLGLQLPGGVMSGIDLLADAAIPLILVQLGVQIGTAGRVRRTPPVLAAVFLRAVAVPLFALGAGLAVGLGGLGLASLVLAAAMPIAVNTVMLAQEYGSDTDVISSAVLVSTLLSLPLLAVLIPLLPRLTG